VIDVFWHDDALLHDTGSGVFEHAPSPLMAEPELHPENAVRVRNMRSILERGPLAEHVRWRPGRHATVEELETVHDSVYIESVRAFCASGGGVLTWSTTVVPESWPAALSAAEPPRRPRTPCSTGTAGSPSRSSAHPDITRSRTGRTAIASSTTSRSPRSVPGGEASSAWR
jgi:hypothetical protein